MTAIHRRVSASGRISLPAEFRKAVGLHAGGDVAMDPVSDEIRIRSVHAAVARAQALSRRILGDGPEGSVQAFLDNRRRGTA
jgi:bifunctional DNA-binding transcriptional regulator/antitoxin component of YhaV-PrlF toxin-antitoxin module